MSKSITVSLRDRAVECPDYKIDTNSSGEVVVTFFGKKGGEVGSINLPVDVTQDFINDLIVVNNRGY